MTVDVKNFYLNTLIKQYEYVCIKLSDIPDEIIQQYNLTQFAYNGHVYQVVRKGMYGLPQVGILAYNFLLKDWKGMDIVHTQQQQGYRDTKSETYCLYLPLMIFVGQ